VNISDNKNIAIDTCDPAGINSLTENYPYKIYNAQEFLEIARSIKSDDEIICIKTH
jgi:hypothetical protein